MMSKPLAVSMERPPPMFVIKRDGRKEPVLFDKITARIACLCDMSPALKADPIVVAQKVVSGVFPGVKTTELDTLAAETAAYMSSIHPHYGELAARIAVSNLQKQTSSSFVEAMRQEYEFRNPVTKEHCPLLADDVWAIIKKNAKTLDAAIDYSRDYKFDYFGFKTLERSYLARVNNKIVERPQHMFMRTAIGIHKADIDAALETYHLLSNKFAIHATPTLFNAGTPNSSMSSCYLLQMQEDSIEGIYDTLKQCALVSKSAGGVGLAVTKIRASGSYIRGTGGNSNGLIPMLRVFNDTARYVDQGGGKRKGAFAVYLEPWHADVFAFLELKKAGGKEEMRARDLFYGLWVPDLFMKRVEADGNWSLFCPHEAPGLDSTWGEEFETLYESYEKRPELVRRTVRAQTLWFAILESQIESGTPYMLYKDACNRKSNQQNLGTICCSNLCTEIVEYTSAEEVAVCNLASISLPAFVITDQNASTRDGKTKVAAEWNGVDGTAEYVPYDFRHLFRATQILTRNLNKVIDQCNYPIAQAKLSNLRHRPIGLGVQGFAEVCFAMRLPFDSPGAKRLNKEIAETIYFAALSASNELAVSQGPYESFAGSPTSRGIFQQDMWNVQPSKHLGWDWEGLRERVIKHGLRNSLLVAPMPTASTAQILGNTESYEPITSNLYTRRVLAGEFVLVNKSLLVDLMSRGLWTPEVRNELFANNGSIQNMTLVPNDLKALYRTVWEIPQKSLVDMAADRGPFIDQSQSFNVFMGEPNTARLTSMHFYGWKRGLKTGMYYLRTLAAAEPIKFTVDVAALNLVSTIHEPTNVKQKQQPENETTNGSKDSNDSTVEPEKLEPADGADATDDTFIDRIDEANSSLESGTVLLCRRDDPDCLCCGS